MKIETQVKLKGTKGNTDLYHLFCSAVKGDFVETTKKSGNHSDIAQLESTLSKAFDQFAQKMFDEGRKYERTVSS